MKVNNYPLKAPAQGDKLFGSDSNGDQVQFNMSDISPAYAPSKYIALISQRGSGVPTADILDNTLGSIVFTKDTEGPGIYYATLTGAFVNNKTWVIINQPADKTRAEVYRDDANTLVINTYNASGVAADGILTDCAIEIRVYA